MKTVRNPKHELIEEIVRRLARRHSTAVVLFHHAVAERLGLGRGTTSASICCASAGR